MEDAIQMNYLQFIKEYRADPNIKPKPVKPQEKDSPQEKVKSQLRGLDLGPEDTLKKLNVQPPKTPEEKGQLSLKKRMAGGWDKMPDSEKGKDFMPYAPAQQDADRKDTDYREKLDKLNVDVLGDEEGMASHPMRGREEAIKRDRDEAEFQRIKRDRRLLRNKAGNSDKDRENYEKHLEKHGEEEGFEERIKQNIFEPDAATRMGKAHDTLGPLGLLDPTSASEHNYKKARQEAEAATLRDPIKVMVNGQEIEVADTPYLRHAYQSGGVGIKQELDDDSINKIIGGMIDFDPSRTSFSYRGKGDPNLSGVTVQDKGGVEKTDVRTPSKRDSEAHIGKAEKEAEEPYLDDNVKNYQEHFRTALDKQDNKRIQQLAFQHDVSPEMYNKFVSRLNSNFDSLDPEEAKKKKDAISGRLQESGLGGSMSMPDGSKKSRTSAAYGGTIEGAEEYLVDGETDVYNWDKMNKDGRDDLLKQAKANRAEQIVMTYLKQGGRDAYANHEGLRSIADMDLEHIKSLTAGGSDHPDNWVFASGELNKLRGNAPLTDRAEKYYELGDDGVNEYEKDNIKKTFDEFLTGKTSAQKKKIKDDMNELLGGSPTKSGGKGIFKPNTYKSLSNDELDSYREMAKKIGFSDEQISNLLPDIDRRTQAPRPGQDIENRPFKDDPERYENERISRERNKILKLEGISKIKDALINQGVIPPNASESQVLNTDAGKDFVNQLKNIGRSTTREEEEVEEVDDSGF